MDADTEDLLKTWGLEEFIQNFRDQRIDTAALSLLNDDLAKELIQPVGPRAKFLANLKEWRNVLQVASGANNLVDDVFLSLPAQPQSCNTSTRCDEPLVIEVLDDSHQSGPSTSSSDQSLESPELKELLESCNDGKALLLKETLDNSSRSKLCDIIIHSELKNDPNAVIPSSRLLFWAQQIVTVFKKEHSSTYFIPYINFNNQKKKAKGKLLNSLHKFRKRYRNLGLIVKRRTSISSPGPSSSSSNTSSNFDLAFILKSADVPEPSEEVSNKILWLQNSTTPFDTVLSYWKATAEVRLSRLLNSKTSISEYMTDYPALRKPTGYVLLMEDFEFMYPNNANGLAERFPLFKEKIIELGKKKAKQKESYITSAIEKLESNDNPDLKEELTTYTALSILAHLMPPNTFSKKKDHDSSVRKTWRPSRSEVKDGFITEVNGAGDILKTVSERKEKLARLGHHMQPYVISVPHDGGICDYYVVVEDCKYLFKSALNAIDCCFKCIHALNAEYSAECSSLWYLIQKGFYNIKTPWDKEYVNVNSLLSDIGITFKD